MNKKILSNVYISFDRRLFDFTLITGDLKKTWQNYKLQMNSHIDFQSFSSNFISLDEVTWMLSMEDFYFAENISPYTIEEILVAQWIDQIEKNGGIKNDGEVFSIKYSCQTYIWIERESKDSYRVSVTGYGSKDFYLWDKRFTVLYDLLKETLDELGNILGFIYA